MEEKKDKPKDEMTIKSGDVGSADILGLGKKQPEVKPEEEPEPE